MWYFTNALGGDKMNRNENSYLCSSLDFLHMLAKVLDRDTDSSVLDSDLLLERKADMKIRLCLTKVIFLQ